MKLTTTAQKLIEAAKLDGWTWDERSWYSPDGGRYAQLRSGGREIQPDTILPDYPGSYDAIIPLIQKQDIETRRDVFRALNRDKTKRETPTSYRTDVDIGDMYMHTPHQLLDALLMAHGFDVSATQPEPTP